MELVRRSVFTRGYTVHGFGTRIGLVAIECLSGRPIFQAKKIQLIKSKASQWAPAHMACPLIVREKWDWDRGFNTHWACVCSSPIKEKLSPRQTILRHIVYMQVVLSVNQKILSQMLQNLIHNLFSLSITKKEALITYKKN